MDVLVEGLLEGCVGGVAVGRMFWWSGCWMDVLVEGLLDGLLGGRVGWMGWWMDGLV
jgi:hypothetical protein